MDADNANEFENDSSEIDDSDYDKDFSMKDCELNSSDSDELCLAEIQRRKRQKKSWSPLVFPEPSTSKNSKSCQGTSTSQDTPSTSSLPESANQDTKTSKDTPCTSSQSELAKIQADGVKEERGRSRKRTRNESSWKNNRTKSLRHSGQRFINESGKEIPARELSSPYLSTCTRKCNSLFSEAKRQELFDNFWSLGDKNKQRSFIASLVDKEGIKRTACQKKSRRQNTYRYYFMKEGVKVQVCEVFFLGTLGIKKDFVKGTVDKKDEFGMLQESLSGKHGKQRKWSEKVVDTVKRHIESFPHVDSHYCRKETTKNYLDQSLSINEMYRLYEKKCKEEGIKEVASKDKYRRIFTEEYNLSFFRPKKDRCDECVAFENNSKPSDEERGKRQKHLENKETARKLKSEAKEKSVSSKEIAACCFDMQQLLPCPKCNSSAFYYKRKLYVHNFTVYDMGTSEVICFMWPEHEGRRGPNEVGTCLARFTEEKVIKTDSHEVHLFSDNCPGQNRNQFVAFMLTTLNAKLKVDKLCLTFLEKGHTETENDSVHSVIERATRSAVIYTPEQWYSAVKSARKTKTPYVVQEMTAGEFIDFKEMSKNVKNLNIDEEGEKVRWSAVKQFIVHGHGPQALYVAYAYGTQTRIDLTRRKRGSSSNAGSQATVTAAEDCHVIQYVNAKVGIPRAKKDDLLSLCQTRTIPAAYHPFHEELTVCDAEKKEDC